MLLWYLMYCLYSCHHACQEGLSCGVTKETTLLLSPMFPVVMPTEQSEGRTVALCCG